MNKTKYRKLKPMRNGVNGKLYLGNLIQSINFQEIKVSFNWKQKIVSLFLMLNLLSVSVFASPETGKLLITSIGELGQDIRFNWVTNQLGFNLIPNNILGLFLGKKSKKTIDKVTIYPQSEDGKLTVVQGEQINFTAIADRETQPVSGLIFNWSVTNLTRNSGTRRLNNGNFIAKTPGVYLITAETQGVQSQITVDVNPNEGYSIQRLLEETEVNNNFNQEIQANEEKQAKVNDLKSKKQLLSRVISTKVEYDPEDEQRQYQEEKEKRQNTQLIQQQLREKIEKHNSLTNDESINSKNSGPSPEQENSESQNTSQNTLSLATVTPKMMRPPEEDGWNGNNWWNADDPGNQTGNPPTISPDAGAGNGNYQISTPILSLAGRGLDVNLSLNYNSRLWGKSGNTMSYDPDKGSPAPGWNLGFGKIMYMGGNGGCMMVDGDGTRRSYSGTNNIYNYGGYYSNNFVGHTSDGSFIDYSCYYSSSTYGTYFSATASLPNGVKIVYSSSSLANDQTFPTQIIDAQGNYITITYIGGRGPNIQNVTDTMGRVISFNYDNLNRLVSVTVPGYNGGSSRVAVRLHYKQLNLNYAFAGGITTDTPTNTPYVLDAIYYPGTQTGYWFGDTDSYSSYGMIAKVIEARAMSWSGSGLNDQGTVTAGTMSKQDVYNYPLNPISNLTDAPTYTTMTESWAGMDTTSAVTIYSINNNDYHSDGYSNSPCYTTKVIRPNGVISKQYAYRTPGAWTDGLIFADETLTLINGVETVISSSLVSWQQGAYDTARPAMTRSTDELQQTAKTEITYGSNFNQVFSKKEFDYNNALVKETKADFYNNSAYTNRHIFNLTKFVEIYDGFGNRLTRTDYEYDNNILNGGNTDLKATPDVIMHLETSDPYTTETQQGPNCLEGAFNYPEYCTYDGEFVWIPTAGGHEEICRFDCYVYDEVSAYNPSSAYRGNLTKITGYSDAQNLGGAISENRKYDVTGNMVSHSNSSNEIATINFDVGMQYAYPSSHTEGAANLNSTLRNTSTTIHDFNTGLIKQTVDKNGRTNSVTFNPDNLRPTVSTSSTGAYIQTTYDDANITVTEETREQGGNLASKNKKTFNGIGKVTREEALGANNIWDLVDTKYTNLGAVWKQTKPYRSGDTLQWSERIYDIQGRVTEVIEADGSSVKAFYNESTRPNPASTQAGQTVRSVDAWGRERWERYDKNGRIVEVVEPNPNGNGALNGSGNLVTEYKYDVNDHLIETIQDNQHRLFKYNSLGLLVRQKLAEQTATLNDAGQYVGAGNPSALWSEAAFYDNLTNLTMKVDARGVKTHYSYQLNSENDPLNRIQAKFYDLSGPLDPNLTIHLAPNVSYEYMTTGDQMRIKKIRTNGILTEDYSYDVEGRVTDYSQTIDYRTSQPMVVSYIYDSLDRVTDVRNPAQYGIAGNPRKLLHNTFDNSGRLTSLLVDGQQNVGNITYDASDRATSLTVGSSGTNQVTEQYTFDAQNGLLTNQKAIRNGQTLLDLSYDYQRNSSIGTLNGKTGHLTKIYDNLNHNRDREYKYDAIGRLITSKGGVNSGLWQQNYQYDRFGNRTAITSSGVAADGSAMPSDGFQALSYNSNTNRITTSNQNGQFEYDSAGNQIRALSQDGQTWLRYEYDTANRLQIVKKDDGTYLQAYQYGAGNIRLMSYDYISNALTLFATHNGTVTTEYTEYTHTVMSWVKSYVYLGENILSTISSNGSGGEVKEFHHYDRLGTRLVTNQQTGTSFEQANLPFGTALNAESTGSTTRRFTSYERSSRTGLDYAQNRSYDAKQGRFTQVDPIGMSAVDLRNPQTLNLYSYCANDPINHTDSDGLFFGFLKKFFNWLGKIMKYIALAIAIVVAVVTIVLMPASAALWFKVFTIVGAIASAASQAFELLGLKTLATIFGIIGAAADFGKSLITSAGKLVTYAKNGVKAILGVIKAGATLASKILTAAGQKTAAGIMGFINTIAGSIDGILKQDPLTNKISLEKDFFAWYKSIRSAAQAVATVVGAKNVANVLGAFSFITDVQDIVNTTEQTIKAIKDFDKYAKDKGTKMDYTWKGVDVDKLPTNEMNKFVTYRTNSVGRIYFYLNQAKKLGGSLNSIYSNLSK